MLLGSEGELYAVGSPDALSALKLGPHPHHDQHDLGVARKAYTLFFTVGTALAIQAARLGPAGGNRWLPPFSGSTRVLEVPVVSWAPLRSAEQLGPLVLFFALQLRKASTLEGAGSSLRIIKDGSLTLTVHGHVGYAHDKFCTATVICTWVCNTRTLCQQQDSPTFLPAAHQIFKSLKSCPSFQRLSSSSPRTLLVSSGSWRSSSWLLPSSSPQAGGREGEGGGRHVRREDRSRQTCGGNKGHRSSGACAERP